jgi:hypothetical protein
MGLRDGAFVQLRNLDSLKLLPMDYDIKLWQWDRFTMLPNKRT